MRKISNFFIFKFSLQGNAIIRFFTIILSMIAYTIFSLTSMGFTGNLDDLNTRGILGYYAPCLNVVYKHKEVTGSSTSIGQENLSLFESILPVSYSYNDWCGLTSIYCYTPNSFDIPAEIYNNSPSVLCATKEFCENVGYELLAGRYPETVTEIAVSENQLDLFMEYGYSNATNRLQWNEKKEIYDFDETIPLGETENINSANDLLGKKLTMWGDLPSKTLSPTSMGGIAFYEVEIVGVVDTHTIENKEKYNDDHIIPSSCIFVSKEWKETFLGKNDELCTRLYFEKPDDYATAYEIVKALAQMEENAKNHGEFVEAGLYLFLPSEFYSAYNIEKWIMTGASIVFLAFSFFLDVRMMHDSIELKRRNVGILRSIGADRKTVVKIFAFELCFISLLSILLSISLSEILYAFVLKPDFTMERYGIALFEYRFINILLLVAIGLFFPILSSFRAIKKFLKESIIENMNNTKSSRRK